MKHLPNLERAVIEVFGGCNYKCKVCPQTTGRGKNWTKDMPIDLFIKILDQLTGNPIINLEGSGEPTLNKNLPKYIEECTRRGFKTYIYTNGYLFKDTLMRDCIDAGLSFVRFSCIGYNREKYKEYMGVDNFNAVIENMIRVKTYISKIGSNCILSSYHLILDINNITHEVEEYKKNIIDIVKSVGYIWKMHNWSNNTMLDYTRKVTTRRTCGRPFAPEITIRAGGINGHIGAVTPCCQTMGPPNEDISVLGHCDTESLSNIWNNDKYNKLREAHLNNDFDKIDYCKNCDFLYKDEDVLIYSNDRNASINKLLGTKFSLEEYGA